MNSSYDYCCICINPFIETNVTVTECGHKLHCTCLIKWLINNNCCPYCKRIIVSMEEVEKTREKWCVKTRYEIINEIRKVYSIPCQVLDEKEEADAQAIQKEDRISTRFIKDTTRLAKISAFKSELDKFMRVIHAKLPFDLFRNLSAVVLLESFFGFVNYPLLASEDYLILQLFIVGTTSLTWVEVQDCKTKPELIIILYDRRYLGDFRNFLEEDLVKWNICTFVSFVRAHISLRDVARMQRSIIKTKAGNDIKL